jgi:hypothetical protein
MGTSCLGSETPGTGSSGPSSVPRSLEVRTAPVGAAAEPQWYDFRDFHVSGWNSSSTV